MGTLNVRAELEALATRLRDNEMSDTEREQSALLLKCLDLLSKRPGKDDGGAEASMHEAVQKALAKSSTSKDTPAA